MATFLCPFGYRLVGPDSIKCGHEGRWTGSVPSCKGKYLRTLQIFRVKFEEIHIFLYCISTTGLLQDEAAAEIVH